MSFRTSAETGIPIVPLQPSKAPCHPSIWPIVRRVKGRRKENNFQLRCLVAAQIMSKQAKLALIGKQMSNSLSEAHWVHHSNLCWKQAHRYTRVYLRSLMTTPNHAYPPLSSGRCLFPSIIIFLIMPLDQ